MGIPPTRYTAFETCHVYPSFELAQKIAAFYDKAVEDLFEVEYKPFIRGIKP